MVLSVVAMVFSFKMNKKNIVMAVIELLLSVAGPVLYTFIYFLGMLYG